MTNIGKWLAGLLALVAAVALLGLGSVYIASEIALHDVSHDAPFEHPIPEDSASIERGRYIARTRGCFGCHGQSLEGKDFGEFWDWPERAVAPNLSKYARQNDAVVLEAAIRQGIGANGKALVSMPSYNFARLSDDDTAALIAFLRTAPVIENKLPTARLGLQARWDLSFAGERHAAAWADVVPLLRHKPEANAALANGEYLGMTMCNECHGFDLRGSTLYGMRTPDLAMVRALEREQFARIIRTGRGLGERHLGLMTLVAPDRYPSLTEQDVSDLHSYLSTLSNEPVPTTVAWRSQ